MELESMLMFSGYPKALIIIPAVFKTTDALIPRVYINV